MMDNKEANIVLKPGEPLRCRLGLPLKGYYVEREILPNSRLALDIGKYIKKYSIKIPEAAHNLLDLFEALIPFPFEWTPEDIYDIEWSNIDWDDNWYSTYQPIIEDVGFFKQYGGRLTNIIEVLDTLESDCSDPKIGSIIAALYIASGFEDEAIWVYENMDQPELYDYYNLGTLYLIEKKDPNKARTYFEKALQLDEARYNMGMSYIYENSWNKAAEYFRHLTELYYLDNATRKAGQYSRNEEIYTMEEINPHLHQISPIISKYEKAPVTENLPRTNDTFRFPKKPAFGKYRKHYSPFWSHMVLLEYMIKQMACNNMGVCSYHINGKIGEALNWFDAALSWEEATRLNIGKRNKQYLIEELLSYSEPVRQESEFPGFKIDENREIIGKSKAMRDLYNDIHRVAPTRSTVLILDETGTGKELVARAIHSIYAKSESKNKFMPLNCGAFTKELIESEIFGHEKGAFTGAEKMREGLLY